MRHGGLHHPGRLHHLRQKHLALTKQVTHDAHAGHQRAFNHVQWPATRRQNRLVGLFGVRHDKVGDTVHHGMAEALRHRHGALGRTAPLQLFALVFGTGLGAVGNLDQALTRIRAAVQNDVFHALAQGWLQVVIHTDHARVDDGHVHARLNGMVQKHGVNGLAHRVIAPEAERYVRHSTRHLSPRQIGLDPARGLDEIDRVIVVLFNARRHGKNIGIENDVFRGETHVVHQDTVSARANFGLALVGVGLSFFIKRHHHGRRTITAHQTGLVLERLNAFFHGNGVDDALALNAAKAGFNYLPLGAVDHDGHTRDVGLRRNQVQKSHHGRLAVKHGLVHVDIDDLRAVFNLLARNRQRLVKLAIQNHAGEHFGARHVGALADVDEKAAGVDLHRLQAGQQHGGNVGGQRQRGRFKHATHL